MGKKSVQNLPGIIQWHVSQLRQLDISNNIQLLEKAGSSAMRKSISQRLGIPIEQFTSYCCAADMMRIHGISTRHVRLLRHCAITGLGHLAQRTNIENLYAQLTTVNDHLKIVVTLPGKGHVRSWVNQAQTIIPLMRW